MNRETDRADTIQVGDWTFYDGYRPVLAVRIQPRLRIVRITTSAGNRKFVAGQPIIRVRDATDAD